MMLVTTGRAARVLGVSAEYVRTLVSMGRLKATRDSSGRRLMKQQDVERLARERQRGEQTTEQR